MGMYDTFDFNCPKCGVETDPQTKLGERCLDRWRLGDETTIDDGIYRLRDKCHECGTFATVVIENKIFIEVLKFAPRTAKQEMPFGGLAPLGTDPEEALKKAADLLKIEFKKMKEKK